MKNTFLLMILAFSAVAFAGKPAVFQKKGAAIRGYDPVSYFTDGQPVKGDKNISHTWNDATWHFASQANLDTFKANPEKYAPQYGGYCAWAMAKGKVAPTDADAWKIVDGKLYLNYDKGIQKKWEKDYQNFITKADKEWPNALD